MAAQEPAQNINEVELKKILINFDRRVDENQKLRIKHFDDPAKFASSETELYAALDSLQGIATQPELYPLLISKKTIKILASLLSHENVDIAAKIVTMLQEFTDIDEDEEQESTESLIEALREENIIDLIVPNLNRFDISIKEDSQAVVTSLSVIDNLIDFDSSFATCGSQQLIRWMIEKLKVQPEFNSIKLSIAELLSILLISARENKLHLNEENGIEALLQQISHYRRVAPVTGDEHEYLEQVVNCLCTAVLDCPENRNSFLKEEGVDLVELILREKKSAAKESNIKLAILKLFNHVLATDENKDPDVCKCCERFIQVLGLKVLFPIFKNPKLILTKKVKRREYYQFLDEVEEHTSAILLALLKYTQNPELIQRVLIKFAESSFEKLDRLLDLHQKYFKAVSNNPDDETDGVNQERAKSSSFFTLRTVDYIILLLCYLGSHFETYDPFSGETFSSRMGKTLAKRVELKHQIILEVKRHIDEVSDTLEEQNSLEMLLQHFEGMCQAARNKN